MNQDPKIPKRSPYLYYAIAALVVMMLLNVFVMPKVNNAQITQVDYSTFLQMIDDGKVDAVELDEEGQEILFSSTDENGRSVYYSTGVWPDDNLVDRLSEHPDIKFNRVVPQENSFLMTFLLTWLFPTLLLMLPLILLSRYMQKKMGGNSMMFGMGKSGAKMYVASQTGKTFADVAGDEEAKEALAEIVDFLHNPAKYNSIGAKMPKGVLLVGPPGTGKTLLAKAVAGEAGVPFFSIAGSEFVEMFVGQGAARVRDLFKQAKEKAPCIVFIDEIDTIGKKRDGSGIGGNDEREQTLNQLLSEMDGFDGSSGVVILAATNRPETLDKALLRPGRFDRRVPVELPDLKAREAILKVHAKKVMMSDDIDYSAIAKATAGCSGAELANLVNEAALRAIKQNRRIVTQADLTESVDVIVAGYQRKNAVLTQHEKEVVAYHEVGHALVAAKQSNSAPVTKITIVPRTSGALGYTMQTPDTDTVLLSKEEALAKIATLTGGRSAEELVFGSVTSGASNDIEQATKLARSMVTRLGMSETFDMTALETVNNQYLGGDASLACSETTSAQIDKEVVSLIRQAHEKAINILKENNDKLHEIAHYLLEKETITGDEFMAILNQ
ncbi:ATP-dependent zinc metalloprotease FtsH [Ruthenibacterium sp. CLA-JM-H11]|uniref:ATP-dependent zinc metalloprotease FtsH n=1 Tax=Ruthenibacterium intestinale TaxID=3133163 RepID=A0ABV1GAR4_9FIRM